MRRAMSILVTGGTGYIGAHLVKALCDRGEEVVIYDVAPLFSAISDIVERVKVVKGDVSDYALLLRTIKENDVDRIIHLASLLSEACRASPYAALKINVEGTVNVLEAARLMDIRKVIYASSRAVYHGLTVSEPLKEDFPKHPKTVYGITKLTCELYGEYYAENYGIDFVALRFSLVYGPSRAPMAFRGVSGAIAEMIEKPALGLPARIPKGGDGQHEFLYIKDAVEALVLATYAKNLRHRVFNISSTQIAKLRDVAEMVKKYIPGAIIELGPGELLPSAYGSLDISRARSELGFEPRYGIEEGVKDYIDEVRARRRDRFTYGEG